MSLDSTAMDHISDDPVLRVPVHRFVWCSCHDSGFDRVHLKLHTFDQTVELGRTAALSYGMGDFDRESYVFGHSSEAPYEPVRLSFGAEWDIAELMEALVALSDDHGAIWFDQLSIPQDAAQIPLHLQNMPNIYRSFEVVILLPNKPCSCLESAVDLWNSGEPRYTDKKGDFNVLKVASECLNAIPISSYHFRLWTKQEFSYARTIRIKYCGPPAGECSRGVYNWLYGISKIPTRDHRFLGLWARWKYTRYLGQCGEQDEFREHTAWSLFRAAQSAGRMNMITAITLFRMRADIAFVEQNINSVYGLYARFILGERMERLGDSLTNVMAFPDMHSKHVASVKRDLALAVFPMIRDYRLPHNALEMDLPALIEDGLAQYERLSGKRCSSMLPQGLFDLKAAGSAYCRPTLYLDADRTLNLSDAYGALASATYDSMGGYDDLVKLHFRGESRPPASRLPHSKTYAAAFGSKTTAEVQDFMRRVGKLSHMSFGASRVEDHEAWAEAILLGHIPAPQDKWPSPAHETAIFAQSLHAERGWGDLLEVDHEQVCYALMCDFVSIHPDVAREKKLGLIVKTDQSPCIGFVNGAVYEGMRHIEKQQQQQQQLAAAQEPVTRDNTIIPEDWVTILVTDTTQPLQRKFLAYEAMFSDRSLECKDKDTKRRVSMCLVVGVWFWSEKDDPCIGAEPNRHSNQQYDAVLV